jgi:hypothetical protein
MEKITDKISVRTKIAQLAKIRLARDFARCKVTSVVIQHIRSHNHKTTKDELKIELPPAWISSEHVQFQFENSDLCLPVSCTRPELKFQPYHGYILSLIEVALHSGMPSSSATGGPLKKKAKISTALAFREEVKSQLALGRKGLETARAKPYAAHAFLDTHEIDASKLERLKAVDVKPTFNSLTKSICTYDLFEIAACG